MRIAKLALALLAFAMVSPALAQNDVVVPQQPKTALPQSQVPVQLHQTPVPAGMPQLNKTSVDTSECDSTRNISVIYHLLERRSTIDSLTRVNVWSYANDSFFRPRSPYLNSVNGDRDSMFTSIGIVYDHFIDTDSVFYNRPDSFTIDSVAFQYIYKKNSPITNNAYMVVNLAKTSLFQVQGQPDTFRYPNDQVAPMLRDTGAIFFNPNTTGQFDQDVYTYFNALGEGQLVTDGSPFAVTVEWISTDRRDSFSVFYLQRRDTNAAGEPNTIYYNTYRKPVGRATHNWVWDNQTNFWSVSGARTSVNSTSRLYYLDLYYPVFFVDVTTLYGCTDAVCTPGQRQTFWIVNNGAGKDTTVETRCIDTTLGGVQGQYLFVVDGNNNIIVQYNDTINITVNSRPSIVDQYLTVDAIAPNPAPVGQPLDISFRLNATTPVELRVQDVQGRVVYRHQNDRLPAGRAGATLDVADLPAGVYSLTVETRFGAISRKFILR